MVHIACKDLALFRIDKEMERIIAREATKRDGRASKLVDGVCKRSRSGLARVASERAVNVVAKHVADA